MDTEPSAPFDGTNCRIVSMNFEFFSPEYIKNSNQLVNSATFYLSLEQTFNKDLKLDNICIQRSSDPMNLDDSPIVMTKYAVLKCKSRFNKELLDNMERFIVSEIIVEEQKEFE